MGFSVVFPTQNSRENSRKRSTRRTYSTAMINEPAARDKAKKASEVLRKE
jgi:hypothetical protein